MKDYSTYTDAELYAFLFGEKVERDSAFTEMYDRYSSRIFMYCRKILGNMPAADDAFQETFALFLKTLSPDREMTNLPAYLIRIARNVCLRVRQRAQSHPEVLFNESLYESPRQDSKLETDELSRLLSLALDILPDDQREALILQAYEDMSYQEISELMNVPLTTVRNWIVRAKRKLREALEQYWADYRK